MGRLKRALRRRRFGVAVLASVAWLASLGLLAREWDTLPDPESALGELRPRIDAALRDKARRTPPLPAGETVTLAANVQGALEGGWLTGRRATVRAVQEFRVGARGDTVDALPETARFEPSVTTAVRWQRVLGLLALLAALSACAVWPRASRGYDAVVCYDSRDAKDVLQWVALLEASGARLCMDRRGAVTAGDVWRRRIARHLSRAPVALVFVGRAQPGRWQAWEVKLITALAEAGHCRFVPAILPEGVPVEPQPWFSRYSAVDLRQGQREGVGALLAGLDGPVKS